MRTPGEKSRQGGAAVMSTEADIEPSDLEKQISSDVFEELRSGVLESKDSVEVLTWSIERFHPRLALSCSFGDPEGMVLLDMMHRIESSSRVFVLDTGRLHQETHDLIDRIRDRYDKKVEVVLPDSGAVQKMVHEHGMNLFYESLQKRQLCCRLRKVDPIARFLADLDAYVTGLRRGQHLTRSEVRKVEVDRANGGILKVNPLVDWSGDDVWQYVRGHEIPVNRLHERGYPSVGCAPCTRAIQAGEDPRAGRWWWENPETKECGLHADEESGGSGI
jgi:phosphoadenosine phosphosulfate reductase